MPSVAVEDVAAQVGEVLGPAHEREELVGGPRSRRRPWPRAAGPARRAGCGARPWARWRPRASARVTTATSSRSPRYLGKMTPAARLADLVAGPADALEPARDGERRLHLDDEVHGAHVDAQLQRAGGDSAGRRPAFSASSISSRCSRASEPWWARTSSSPASSLSRWARRSARRRLLTKTIVLRWARMSSRIRGWMAGQMLVRASRSGGRSPGLLLERDGLAEAAHVVDGHDHLELERLAHAGVHDRHRSAARPPPWRWAGARPGSARPPPAGAAWRTGRCAAAACGPGRRAAPARAPGARRAWCPARAWISSTITHSTPRSASRACGGQDQVERLGRRDQDVRRVLPEGPPLVGRRVAGAHPDPDVRLGQAQSLGRQRRGRASGARRLRSTSWTRALSGETYSTRSAAERLGRRRLGHQPVQAPQERGERLAGAGGRADQRVLAGRDRRPALGLGRRRGAERAAEPRPGGGAEQLERVGRRRGLVAAGGGSARGHGWRV